MCLSVSCGIVYEIERTVERKPMAREASSGQITAASIRREAARSFAERGYEATSLRQVAADVGIKVGSLYNHITSKEDLLFSVMGGTMDELSADLERALEGKVGALDQLVAFLGCHIRFHAEHAQQVFIGNTELRALSAEARQSIAEKRRKYRQHLESLIVEVQQTGVPDPLNPRLHTFSVVAIGTHVASWYRPDGGFELDEIVRDYTKIVLRSLQVPGADARVDEVLKA